MKFQNRFMRALAALLVASVFAAFSFSCAKKSAGSVSDKADAKPRTLIVTTIFPAYDWVKQVIADKSDDFEVVLLTDKGADLHSYQPSADDIIRITDCSMLVCVGGNSDAWVFDFMYNENAPRRKDKHVVSMMHLLDKDVKTEDEIQKSCIDHKAEEHDHASGNEKYDEHVWLSVRNAQKIVRKIADELCLIDPSNSDSYRENADSYISKLQELDAHCNAVAKMAKRSMLLFADRFPFGYFVCDYGLSFDAAFSGCSSESDASFLMITSLADKLKQFKLPAVVALKGRSHNIPESVLSVAAVDGVKVVTVDSMESLTSKDRASGITYASVMEDNLDSFRQALN